MEIERKTTQIYVIRANIHMSEQLMFSLYEIYIYIYIIIIIIIILNQICLKLHITLYKYGIRMNSELNFLKPIIK